MSAENNSRSERWADAGVLAFVFLSLLIRFPPSLLFSNTVAAGGDTTAHFYTGLYLKSHLLPRFQITGWTMANYAGFPLLQFYFPLPFLFIVALSWIMPMTVAFKIGTVLGVFVLPFAVYAMLRLLRFAFPVPVLGAVTVLSFLFIEANSYWGGNIPSTLAGEFSYSWSMSLAFVWLGSLYRGIESRKNAALNGVLLALVGFCHGYPLIFSGFASLFFLCRKESFGRNFWYLCKVHALAIALMALWFLPLVAFTPWTTAYNITLTIEELKDVLPQILWPFLGFALLGVWGVRNSAVRYILWMMGWGVVLFLIGPALGIVDFRFLPFSQVGVCLLAAIGLGWITRNLRGKPLIVLAVFLAVQLWIQPHLKTIPTWVRWNYSGLEVKPLWPQFKKVNELLKGKITDPRIVFEHSDRHDAVGTTRVWECLPVFANRATLEHSYMQASPNSPFVFYLQSEVSDQNSCPYPSYSCGRLDYERAKRHLDLFNVRELVVISDKAKNALDHTSGYHFKAAVDPYAVYEREGPRHFVEPLAYEPVLWDGPEPWKEAAYTWFRSDAVNDVHLVFPVNASEKARFSLSTQRVVDTPHQRLEPPSAVEREELTDEEIRFETKAIGKPHLIKVSYHPNWKVEGADHIYLVSPAFMLVYPTQSHVRLYFGSTWPDKLGLALTLISLCLVVIPVFRRRFEALILPEAVGGWVGRLWLPSLTLTVVFCVWMGMGSAKVRWSASDKLMEKAMKFKDDKKWDQAETIFRKVARERPVSRFAEQARYYLGLMPYLQEKPEQSILEFQALLDQFPDSQMAAEAYYHIALCQDKLGRRNEAVKIKHLLEKKFPRTEWAGYARNRWP